MNEVKVQKVTKPQETQLPVFAEMERMMEKIRRRAFEFAAGRGFGEGGPLDDWLMAEREFCWPAAEFLEGEKEFVVKFGLPGFEPGEVTVTALPQELVVQAKTRHEAKAPEGEVPRVHWSEFRREDVYRRIGFGTPIDVPKVAAVLKDGMLTVTAPKAVEGLGKRVVPVAMAA